MRKSKKKKKTCNIFSLCGFPLSISTNTHTARRQHINALTDTSTAHLRRMRQNKKEWKTWAQTGQTHTHTHTHTHTLPLKKCTLKEVSELFSSSSSPPVLPCAGDRLLFQRIPLDLSIKSNHSPPLYPSAGASSCFTPPRSPPPPGSFLVLSLSLSPPTSLPSSPLWWHFLSLSLSLSRGLFLARELATVTVHVIHWAQSVCVCVCVSAGNMWFQTSTSVSECYICVQFVHFAVYDYEYICNCSAASLVRHAAVSSAASALPTHTHTHTHTHTSRENTHTNMRQQMPNTHTNKHTPTHTLCCVQRIQRFHS